jgi:hypothetical protein
LQSEAVLQDAVAAPELPLELVAGGAELHAAAQKIEIEAATSEDRAFMMTS